MNTPSKPVKRSRRLSGNRFLAGLLAFIVPGAGHLALGRISKGLLLLALSVLNLAAMIYYANGGKHLLLVGYLSLTLPAIYFYSVYDALQHAYQRAAPSPSAAAPGVLRRRGSEITALQGIGIIVVSLVLVLLLWPGDLWHPLLNQVGNYGPGLGLISLAVVLLRRSSVSILRIGRVSSALILLFIGGTLLWYPSSGGLQVLAYLHWWPAALVLFGLEVVWFSTRGRSKGRKIGFDLTGIALPLTAVVLIYALAQLVELPIRWLDQFNAEISPLHELTEEKGYHFERDPLYIQLENDTRHIEIINPNGSVTVRPGNVIRVKIESEVWIDLPDEQSAAEAAGLTGIETELGRILQIKSTGASYGEEAKLKPHMNLIVTIPASLTTKGHKDGEHPSLKVEAMNGIVQIENIDLPGGIKLGNPYGEITALHTKGNLHARTNSGNIRVAYADGDVHVETTNGKVTALDISGNLTAAAVNGDVEANNIGGDVTSEVKNGSIQITEASAEVKANTLNGGIAIESSIVGGAWDIDSAIGEITLSLPEDGDYTVQGAITFGEIYSELPLTVSKKMISGQLGLGTYQVAVHANSNIEVKKYRMPQEGAFIDKQESEHVK
ncbi:hypothetical protein EBB07_21640 [Paenibacillaceae bacterium]|nr:hypothetical protein EBB07_21640 [Paenibacillaceae bacterium]